MHIQMNSKVKESTNEHECYILAKMPLVDLDLKFDFEILTH